MDWSRMFKKYKGLWVALDDDESTVVSSGKTAREALDKSVKKGYKNPILTLIPEETLNFVGYNL